MPPHRSALWARSPRKPAGVPRVAGQRRRADAWQAPSEESGASGALPLSFGIGGELSRPLGLSIVGELMVSQVLTLYTTPVLYLLLDRLRAALPGYRRRLMPWGGAPGAPAE